MLSGAKHLFLLGQLTDKQILRFAQDDTHDRVYTYFRDTPLAYLQDIELQVFGRIL